LHLHFIGRGQFCARHGETLFTEVMHQVPPILLCYSCTALRHAHREWVGNGGHRLGAGVGQYYLDGSHDRGLFTLHFYHSRLGLTHVQTNISGL
jgi:hypothetical protein